LLGHSSVNPYDTTTENSALLTAVAVLGWGTVAHELWLAAARIFIYPRSLDPHQT